MFGRPVFIADSFRKPLFNRIMAEELMQTAAWSQNELFYTINTAMIKDINLLIREITAVNDVLLKTVGTFKMENHTNVKMLNVNRNIIYYSAAQAADGNKFLTGKNQERLYCIYRALSDKRIYDDEDFIQYNFLISFFKDLLCTYFDKIKVKKNVYQPKITAERIRKLAREKDLTINAVLMLSEVSSYTFDSLCKNSPILSVSLIKIADTLGCSVDYLTGRTSNPNIQR